MIIQININDTNKYDKYINFNKQYEGKVDHRIFGEKEVNDFLHEYNYIDDFNRLKLASKFNQLYEPAVKCDFVRLAMLYEFGGVYVDLDVYFNKDIANFESHLENKYRGRDVFLNTNSIYFFKCSKHSESIKHHLNKYIEAEVLHLDTEMIKNAAMLTKNLIMVSPSVHDNFFVHDHMTTGRMSNQRIINLTDE